MSKFFFDILTQPLKCVLGIDEFKKSEHSPRSWKSTKDFYSSKMKELEVISSSTDDSAISQLKKKCAEKVRFALLNQLHMSAFFDESAPEEDKPDATIEQAPQTNLGCESEFGFVTNDFKQEGGSTSLATISDKHVIQRNKLYEKERWIQLSKKERQRKWKWARNSNEAKMVKEMEAAFLERVKSAEMLSIKAKENDKQKKIEKLQAALYACKKHGGPLTKHDLVKIDELGDEELAAEAKYLKLTIAPNIRFKHLVNRKMIPFTTAEVRQQVKDAIAPACSRADDSQIDSLIVGVLKSSSVTSEEESNRLVMTGIVAWWIGPLCEKTLGVALDETTLQLYELARFGFRPRGLAVELSDWKLDEQVENYHYEERGNSLYLCIS